MEARQELVYESIRKSLVALSQPGLAVPQLQPLRKELEETARLINELATVQEAINAVRHGLAPIARAAAAPTSMQRFGDGEGGSRSASPSGCSRLPRKPRWAITRRP